MANGQFIRMRDLAARWAEGGGMFIAAASLAPFKAIKDDPAGCRDPGAEARPTCPLYAFAFVAPGDETRLAAVLARVFQHLFTWPLPAAPPADLALVVEQQPRQDITVERRWAQAGDGTPIVRVRGPAATNRPLGAQLAVRDTSTPAGRAAAAAMRGQQLRLGIVSRTLAADAEGREWTPVQGRGAHVRPVDGRPRASSSSPAGRMRRATSTGWS